MSSVLKTRSASTVPPTQTEKTSRLSPRTSRWICQSDTDMLRRRRYPMLIHSSTWRCIQWTTVWCAYHQACMICINDTLIYLPFLDQKIDHILGKPMVSPITRRAGPTQTWHSLTFSAWHWPWHNKLTLKLDSTNEITLQRGTTLDVRTNGSSIKKLLYWSAAIFRLCKLKKLPKVSAWATKLNLFQYPL